MLGHVLMVGQVDMEERLHRADQVRLLRKARENRSERKPTRFGTPQAIVMLGRLIRLHGQAGQISRA